MQLNVPKFRWQRELPLRASAWRWPTCVETCSFKKHQKPSCAADLTLYSYHVQSA